MRDEHLYPQHPFFGCEKAETAVTHMIFFIAAIIIAMGVVTVLSADIQSMVSSSSVNSKLLSEQIRTDITIVNDPYIIPYDATGHYYTFYAKNTGKTELAPEFITVLVDGILIESTDMDVDLPDGDVVWRPGDVLLVNVTTTPDPLEAGDHRVVIAAENGKSGGMNFIT
ncbi:flagellar protein G [Methanolobus sp. ZRKC2]|uniref:flagellar protein G n=1 Tax=Methanolobus sp. ZRKC2 TaxID=3125783 RepID=UPI0032508001